MHCTEGEMGVATQHDKTREIIRLQYYIEKVATTIIVVPKAKGESKSRTLQKQDVSVGTLPTTH